MGKSKGWRAVRKCRQINTKIGEGEREEEKIFSLYLFPLSLPFISLTWWKQEGQLVFDVCPYAKTKTRLSAAITLECQLIVLRTGFIRLIVFLCLHFRNVWRSEKYTNLSYNEIAFSTLCRLLLLFSSLYAWSRLDHTWSNVPHAAGSSSRLLA